MATKNDASYSALKAKYFEVYFLDLDVQSNDGITKELRRVVDMDWSKIKGSSKYVAITEIVQVNVIAVPSSLNYDSYMIAEEFHDMILTAKDMNTKYVMVAEPMNVADDV